MKRYLPALLIVLLLVPACGQSPTAGGGAPEPQPAAENQAAAGQDPPPETQDPAPAADDAPPNVLFILVDTLRADRLGGERNGVPVMPRLAGYAESSMRFGAAAVQATWTKPSMVSIFTSLYAETHGVQFGLQKEFLEGQEMVIETLPDYLKTMPELFQERGYATWGYQTNGHLNALYGFSRGFDEYVEDWLAEAEYISNWAIGKVREQEQPFFLYLHYFDPHASYEKREPHFSSYGDPPQPTEEDLELLREDYAGNYYLDRVMADVRHNHVRRHAQFSPAGRDYIRWLYDSECGYTDTHVARLLEAVETHAPNTVVVFLSDHGEELWEHGSIGHGRTVYEEVAHVPFFIRFPGGEGRYVDTPVESIDLLPTLAHYLGWPAEDTWQGRNLLAQPPAAERPVFSYTRGSIPEFELHWTSIRLGDYKLIHNHAQGNKHLYRLSEDPTEQHDLAADPAHGQALARLEDAYRAHKEALAIHPYAEREPGRMPLHGEDRDRMLENMEQINAMGYAGTLPEAEGDAGDGEPIGE